MSDGVLRTPLDTMEMIDYGVIASYLIALAVIGIVLARRGQLPFRTSNPAAMRQPTQGIGAA